MHVHQADFDNVKRAAEQLRSLLISLLFWLGGTHRAHEQAVRPGILMPRRQWPASASRAWWLDTEYAPLYICMTMQITAFQTLADPTRLRIVEALAGGEQAVGELVRAVDIDQSGVSRHLRILGEAGFVTMRPDGARRLYSLRPEPFQAIDGWVGNYRKLWNSRLDRLDAALARRRRVADGEGPT